MLLIQNNSFSKLEPVAEVIKHKLESNFNTESSKKDFLERLFLHFAATLSHPMSDFSTDADLQFLSSKVTSIEDILHLCISSNVLPCFIEVLFEYDIAETLVDALDSSLANIQSEIVDLSDSVVTLFCFCCYLLKFHADENDIMLTKASKLVNNIEQLSKVAVFKKFSENHSLAYTNSLKSLNEYTCSLKKPGKSLDLVKMTEICEAFKLYDTPTVAQLPLKLDMYKEDPVAVSVSTFEKTGKIVQDLNKLIVSTTALSHTESCSCVFQDLGKLVRNKDLDETEMGKAGLEQAKIIISNRLSGYNQACEVLIKEAIDNHFDIDLIETRLKVLESNISAMISFSTVKLLLDLINKLVLTHHSDEVSKKCQPIPSDKLLGCIARIRSLCGEVMQLLSLDSLLALFDYQIELAANLSCYVEYDSVNGMKNQISSDFKEESVNSVLNELLKFDVEKEKALIKDVLIMACFDPYEILYVILHHVLVGQNDFENVVKLLCYLSSFLNLSVSDPTACQKSNMFLKVCMSMGFKTNQINITKQAARFLSSVFTKLKSKDIGVAENLAKILYINYMKDLLDLEDTQESKNKFLDAFTTMFFDLFVKGCVPLNFKVDIQEIFVLTYAMGRYIDNDEKYSEILQNRIAEICEFLIFEIKEKIKYEDEQLSKNLYRWLSWSLSSLDWTTQLYFCDLFTNNTLFMHIFPIPRCFDSLFSMPEGCKIRYEYISEHFPVTSWLRTVIKQPKVFPCSSLLDKVTPENKSSFHFGLIVGLMQILPGCSAPKWEVLHSCLETLIALGIVKFDVLIQLPDAKSSSDLTCCNSSFQLLALYTQLIVTMYDENCGMVLIPSQEQDFEIHWQDAIKEIVDKFSSGYKQKHPDLVVFVYCHTLLTLCNTHNSIAVDASIRPRIITLMADLLQNLDQVWANAKKFAKQLIETEILKHDKELLLGLNLISPILVDSFRKIVDSINQVQTVMNESEPSSSD